MLVVGILDDLGAARAVLVIALVVSLSALE